MFRAADKALKSAGIVQTRLQYEETLDSGFAFGLWWKYDPRPTEGRDQLAAFLSRIGVSFEQLRALPSDQERLALVADKLAQERPGLQHWFKVGMWVFANAWLLGSARYADTTESARELMREDREVRGMSSNLMGCLIDIGWSPDEAENFYVGKLIPFLFDPGHHKWVDNPSMAVMSDLRFKAKAIDTEKAKDNDSRRVTGAARALVSELPVVGKAFEILIIGAKK